MTRAVRWSVATALVLSGCAPAASRAVHAAQPSACSDSIYVHLSRQHPDSLSERSWQRLQSLDSACARARAAAPADPHGTEMMGMGGSGKVWTLLAPIVVVGMAVMMAMF